MKMEVEKNIKQCDEDLKVLDELLANHQEKVQEATDGQPDAKKKNTGTDNRKRTADGDIKSSVPYTEPSTRALSSTSDVRATRDLIRSSSAPIPATSRVNALALPSSSRRSRPSISSRPSKVPSHVLRETEVVPSPPVESVDLTADSTDSSDSSDSSELL